MKRIESKYWAASHRIIVDFLSKIKIDVDLPFPMRFRKEIMDLQSEKMFPVTIIIYGKCRASIDYMDTCIDDNYVRLRTLSPKYIDCLTRYSSMILATYLKANGDDIVREINGRIEYLQSVLP